MDSPAYTQQEKVHSLVHQTMGQSIHQTLAQMPFMVRHEALEALRNDKIVELLKRLMASNQRDLLERLNYTADSQLAETRSVYMSVHVALGVLHTLAVNWSPDFDRRIYGPPPEVGEAQADAPAPTT